MNVKNLGTKGVFILFLFAIILFAILIFWTVRPIKVSVITDKTAYNSGDPLKVKIVNASGKQICFSSCYPYYLEKKNIFWSKYPYPACPSKDESQWCVGPNATKAFEIVLNQVQKGLHRLTIPACIGCSSTNPFSRDFWINSNSFKVN